MRAEMPGAVPDYYQVLGVDPRASAQEIHAAFRHRAHECHPDLHPGNPAAAERFKAVNEAYHHLSNEEERRAYDASLTTTEAGHADLETTVLLGLRELFTGCQVQLPVPRATPCVLCGGGGMVEAVASARCSACDGSGWGPEEIFLGVRSRERCPRCYGRGRVEGGLGRRPCLPCRGVGWFLVPTLTEVRLPPGLSDGQRLRVPGQGQPLLQGGQGDLYLRVRVRPGAWARQGDDLVVDLEAPSKLLSRGGRVPFSTPLDAFTVAVPRGARYGQSVAVRGRGLPSFRGDRRGDLWVRFVPPSAGR